MAYKYTNVREYDGGLIFEDRNKGLTRADTAGGLVVNLNEKVSAGVASATNPYVFVNADLSGGSGGAYLGNMHSTVNDKTYPLCGLYAYGQTPTINYAIQPFDFHVNASSLKYTNTPGENPVIQKISDCGVMFCNINTAANRGTVMQMASGGVGYIQIGCVTGNQGNDNPSLGFTARDGEASNRYGRLRWDGLTVKGLGDTKTTVESGSVTVYNAENAGTRLKMVDDGLYWECDDGTTIYLKFTPDGIVTINGKEIATKE